jgi:hypothetical protein
MGAAVVAFRGKKLLHMMVVGRRGFFGWNAAAVW